MKKLCLIFLGLLLCGVTVGCGSIKKSSSNPAITEKTLETALPTSAPVSTPAQTKATLHMTQRYEDANRNVSILGLQEYSKLAGKDYTDKAGKGKKYLVLFLKIYNKRIENEYFNVNYLSAKIDGKSIQNTYLYNKPHEYSTIFEKIDIDSSITGYIVWKVPQNWKKLEVTYSGWANIDGVTLQTTLTPKDLSKPKKYESYISSNTAE